MKFEDRYSRQVLFPGIGREGQALMAQGQVAVWSNANAFVLRFWRDPYEMTLFPDGAPSSRMTPP